jgi:hypothetical protein
LFFKDQQPGFFAALRMTMGGSAFSFANAVVIACLVTNAGYFFLVCKHGHHCLPLKPTHHCHSESGGKPLTESMF